MVTMFGFVGVNIIGRSCSVRGRGRRALTSMNVNHYRVFQTNDDGYSSRGLARMNQAIVESKIAGDTIVVAPSKDQSACGQKLTLQDPISLERHIKRGKHWYSLDGTPADCAILALDYGGIAIDHPPSIVVSGINHGPNMTHDVLYSGTFAAARQASMLGYPSIATSLAAEFDYDEDLDSAVSATMAILEILIRHIHFCPPNYRMLVLRRKHYHSYKSLEDCKEGVHAVLLDAFQNGDIFLNINTPIQWSGEFRSTKLGARAYREVVQRKDNQMRIVGKRVEDMPTLENTDLSATKAGHCSVTTFQTWPDTHLFRVPEFIMKAALEQSPSGLPVWIERIAEMADRV